MSIFLVFSFICIFFYLVLFLDIYFGKQIPDIKLNFHAIVIRGLYFKIFTFLFLIIS